jgi:hypothetical protein
MLTTIKTLLSIIRIMSPTLVSHRRLNNLTDYYASRFHFEGPVPQKGGVLSGFMAGCIIGITKRDFFLLHKFSSETLFCNIFNLNWFTVE